MNFNNLQQRAADCLAHDKYNEAITLYEQCIEANPTVGSNYWQLGLALLLQKKELAAKNIWLSGFTKINPENFEVGKTELIKILEVEALLHLHRGNSQNAEMIYWQIIEYAPNNIKADACNSLGIIFTRQGQYEQAITCYQQALSFEPNYIDACKNLGVVFTKQGQYEQAIACYQQALSFEPNCLGSYNNLGAVFMKQGQYEQAITCYQQALNLNPNYIDAYNNLGAVFTEQGQYEQAIACYQQALNLNPNYIDAYNNLGAVFTEQGQYEQAIACYIQALELNPNDALAHFNLAFIMLLAGDFEHGFTEYEWRWQCPQHLESYPSRKLSQPLWDGSNLDDRTLLLHSEQGFGDTIQFIRYAPLVAQRGGRVVLECQEPLIRLLKTVAGIEQFVVKGKALPEFHVHAPLISLPRILGTTLENIPAQVPYLAAPESSINLKAPTDSRLKVGIVWAGSSTNQRDRTRSCFLNHFFRLLNTPSVAFYSLQKGPRAAELTQSCELPVQDLSSHLCDFADTAAAVAQLDLVITVDTSVAHLAGAMNKPVWVLLSFSADWRWMLGREDSPWYPSMRLFRQEFPGDWAGLLQQVETALQTHFI